MPDILEIDSVIKSYNGKQVLTDIYLKCETGNIVGLLGRNGSGKSTLLKILFGTVLADRKFIKSNGKVYNKPYKETGLITYLPQDNFLPHNLKIETIVAAYLGENRVVSFLDDQLLVKLWGQKVSSLSGGELRYLEIKLLLESSSKFVLLDEPFNGVAPVLIDTIKDLIRQAALTKGIILTDHDYRNVLDVANTWHIVFDGAIKQINHLDELYRYGYIPDL
ncbi:ATP-binding cassette domain-containing protein [Snuella sedimenti]|uniref:ATP-binding cassette domain-containing protein n=1 Tax=Snuella sedimenti TaxID=2798802 RepID=A0A8J7J5Y0_9FLAO|nr:ATP-binding cassette domain-containing protein [Snuella sedimenti]MBJ6369443.1 ATP-binding cassette domain-containing protein [Snuella sedimenti]